jgi:hypothetical protein
LTFLLNLTHEEQVELANKTDVDIRSAKPGTAQAAVSFMLEDSIKQLCRLGVNKKATRCATSSKPSETTSIGTPTFSENRTAAVSSLATIKKPNFAPSKNMSNGSKKIETRHGDHPPGTSLLFTMSALRYH